MRNHTTTTLVLGLIILFAMAARADQPATKDIPEHPDKLVYPALKYTLPPASEFREVLPSGLVVYIAEDRMLPLFDINVTLRVGGAFEPADKAGLAALVGEQLREGGTETYSPAELDEQVEFLAAQLMSRVSDTRGSAGVSLLSKDIDAGMELLIDMLRHPRFDEERLRQAKERRLQNIKRRNDSSSTIEEIEWGFLMQGAEHFSNRYPSTKTINSITRDDLIAFHREYYHPGNMIVTATGDFDRKEMLAKIEQAFGDWPVGQVAAKTFPAPEHEPEPGVYVVQKDDVNQGRVSLGHKAIMRGSPDEFALIVMDTILGQGGFQSRLVQKVRSEEGLAYSVGSNFGQGTYYPGNFWCFFQSKSNACAYATQLVLNEINRLRTEKVGQEELDGTLSQLIESFPQRFPNKGAILRTYVADEYTGRDPAYWETYVEQLKSVTSEDILRVAQQYLHPDQLVILVVGDTEVLIAGGHDKDPEVGLERFGKVTKLLPRDPDTLTR
ncbi:MAG: pitrilysin family protein [Planctomycetota bacterium]